MPSALAIAAHPDDIEFFMSGTLILLREAGYEIHYLNLADGCCGTTKYDAATIAAMRKKEAQAAAASIGAIFHASIARDLEIFYDRPTLAKVASIVRQVAPRIVLTHAPSDYMEDHMNASRLAVTAAFARGMPNFPVDPPAPAVEGKVTVYHAQPYGNCDPLRQPVRPDLFVNVARAMDRKLAMIACHESQHAWLDESQGVSSLDQTMRSLAMEVGAMSGRFLYAEGWRRHLHLGFCDPADDPLYEALAPAGVALRA